MFDLSEDNNYLPMPSPVLLFCHPQKHCQKVRSLLPCWVRTRRPLKNNNKNKQVIVHPLHTYLTTRLLCWWAKLLKLMIFQNLLAEALSSIIINKCIVLTVLFRLLTGKYHTNATIRCIVYRERRCRFFKNHEATSF